MLRSSLPPAARRWGWHSGAIFSRCRGSRCSNRCPTVPASNSLWLRVSSPVPTSATERWHLPNIWHRPRLRASSEPTEWNLTEGEARPRGELTGLYYRAERALQQLANPNLHDIPSNLNFHI